MFHFSKLQKSADKIWNSKKLASTWPRITNISNDNNFKLESPHFNIKWVTLTNLALILTRVIFFGEPADDPYAFQPLKRISTVDLLSWLLHNKNWLLKTGRHLSPCGGRERRLDDTDGYNGHNRCYKQDDMPRERLLCKTFVYRSIIELGKKLLQYKFSKGLLRVESSQCTTSFEELMETLCTALFQR